MTFSTLRNLAWLLPLTTLTACMPTGPGMPDANAPDAPNPACSMTGAPVMHVGTIAASERWSSGVHLVSATVSLARDAVLTIDGCTEVRLAPDASIEIDNTGARLVAQGTAERPIRFVRAESGRAWGRIRAGFEGSVSLAYATLEGGGTTNAMANETFSGATIAVRGAQEVLPAQLQVDHVTVRGSTGLGVAMVASRFVAGSTDLTITGSGSYPLYTAVDIATDLPAGTYTGNAVDEILLQTSSTYSNDRPLRADATLRARGVPYRVGHEGGGGADIVVGDGREEGPPAVLDIEPGVTIRFTRSAGASRLYVQGHLVGGQWQAQGALRIQGTAAAPVTLTSASAAPAPGDWTGLYFKDVIDPRTRVDHAVIEYAGGESGTRGVCASNGSGDIDADSAIIIFLQPNVVPPGAFVTNTVIRNSANGGVYRSWYMQDIDFTATNTFENVAGCRQSGVQNPRGGCVTMTCM